MTKRKILILILITILFSCKMEDEKSDQIDCFNYTINLSDLVDSLNIKSQNLNILIDKSDYILSVLNKDKVVKEYPVVFGSNPVDDKLMEGDKCTPEGIFKVKDLYPHRLWSKFIWIDYPNNDSWGKHKKAKEDNKIPGNTKIGGEIGIHGVPDNKSYLITKRQNWTLGCISLKNDDINDLYPLVYKGMKIIIKK